MGRDTSRRARAESLAKASSDGAETLMAHAEQAAHTARAAAATGLHTLQDAVHENAALHDAAAQVKNRAAPARDAARQLADQARHTAGTLTARAGHPGHNERSWRARTLIAAACALGAGALIWWLARPPEDGSRDLLSDRGHR